MTLFSFLLVLIALPVSAASVYLLLATLLATLLSRRPLRVRATTGDRLTRFVVVVPAHNEAAGLPETLRSLRALSWPSESVRTLVVADNCTDDTAAVAASLGAEVLVREDLERRGKGYALEAAFARLQAEAAGAWDALVVVDADTEVEAHLLQAVHARLAAGADALQVAYLSRAGSAPLHAVTEVALWASHVVRGRAREGLSLSAGLRGNGMVLSRAVVERVPYSAFSAVEDLEYGLLLGLHGIRVGFVPETVVRGDMPSDARTATTQRHRWIGGRAAVAQEHLRPLLRAAVARRSAMLFDLAIDLAIPPLSLLVLVTMVGLPLAAFAWWAGHAAPLALWAIAAFGLAVHVADAAIGAGRAGALLRAAAMLPSYMLDKTRLTVRAVGAPTRTWVRTARTGELR